MRFFDAIINTLFPPRCLGCGKNITTQSEVLCSACRKKIILPDTLFCGFCEARLPLGKKICHLDTPYILGSVARYEESVIKKMILALKFRRSEFVGPFLGSVLADYIENLNPRPAVFKNENTSIIPIPLSRERLRERGFNQASIIAKAFAEKTKLPILENVLTRTRNTPPQSQSENRKDRFQNVENAFSLQHTANLEGKRVILIDDVVTTGATLRSASETLKQNGVKEIIALTIAR
ncbi:MAG: ComF family protein [Patescibacteria group bacterium]